MKYGFLEEVSQTDFLLPLKEKLGQWDRKVFKEHLAISSIDASSIISTSSTSDALMSGMSKSPEPGTYLVFFNSQYSFSRFFKYRKYSARVKI
jgi:hypothetical protein